MVIPRKNIAALTGPHAGKVTAILADYNPTIGQIVHLDGKNYRVYNIRENENKQIVVSARKESN